MTFALVLACTVAACFALRNPLKACPMAFYAAALLVDVAFVAGTFWGMPRDAWSVFFVLIQKCLLPLALFVVVMYIGVLDRGSRACMWLKPVRAELSIVAWLLSLGHVAVYGATYLPRIASGGATNGNVAASFAVAVVLLALLAVLGVTSFNLVKRRMRTETWKKVQKLAYPFFVRAPTADAGPFGAAWRRCGDDKRCGILDRVRGIRRFTARPRGEGTPYPRSRLTLEGKRAVRAVVRFGRGSRRLHDFSKSSSRRARRCRFWRWASGWHGPTSPTAARHGSPTRR